MKKISGADLLLFGVSFVISILVAEALLQISGFPPPIVSGWLNTKPNITVNEMGFRGQDINYSDEDFVVVLLGDSQVAAMACSTERMPEQRLEFYLNQIPGKQRNIKVFSLGAGGYGQDQQLLILEKYYQRYKADMVILWQTPTNDVWNNTFPTHWPVKGWPKPTYRLIEGELHGPSEEFGEILGWSKLKLFALANRIFKFVDRDRRWEQYLPQPYTPIADYQGEFSSDWQRRWDDNIGLMRDENLETEKSHMAIYLTPASPRMKYGLDLSKILLAKIKDLVEKNNGTHLIFHVRPPDEPQSNTDGKEVVQLLNGKFYRTSKRQFQENLDYLNSESSSLTLPITITNWRSGPTSSHLNENATDQVMRDLASKIQLTIVIRE